jgi:hypothetical protein
MIVTAEIDVKNPKLLELLKIEYRDTKKERFEITVDTKVKIKATDAIALKAILTSVANSISVFEKMGDIK